MANKRALFSQCGGWLRVASAIAVLLVCPRLFAGGPRLVAGTTYFDPAAAGHPVRWATGVVPYWVDPGPLNDSISNDGATAMVDAAAAQWNAVPTAAVALIRQGTLNEDVSGANVQGLNQMLVQPADGAAGATNYPLGVVFDADGAVLDTVLGPSSSDVTNCQSNGVVVWVDNIRTDATVAHALMVVNGRCASTPRMLSMLQFQLTRAFGQVLGLGFSQVNPSALRDGDADGAQAWPIMQPHSGACGYDGGDCIPGGTTLSSDDIAALDRLYPVTPANQATFPGKLLTSAHTVSSSGTIAFRNGTGMQGVNVVARPLDAQGKPMRQYTVTAVSGAYFAGKHGNGVTGWTDSKGGSLAMWGSGDPALQGYFDLSGLPLPPGLQSASYQITFESIDPLSTGTGAVGPYQEGSPDPSGTLAPVTVTDLSPGSTRVLTVQAEDTPTGDFADPISTESAPRSLPSSGLWCGRLNQISQTDWLIFPVRGNRIFTVVTEALDENGLPTNHKAMPTLGVWDGFTPPGTSPVHASPGLNGWATGETWLQVTSRGDDLVRLGIADTRGDGRPDYAYNGWVLYADSVQPARLPAAGGPIVIHGMGFHIGDTVLVGGKPAPVTAVSPNEITAIAPPADDGVTGSVDVEVDDQPAFYALAVIGDGLSYDAASGDALTLVNAPANAVPIGVPLPFTVKAVDGSLRAAGGVTVTYSLISGNARLECGRTTCSATAGGDGVATLNVAATDSNPSVVQASLNNGSSLQAHFSGGSPAILAALTPTLSVAAGASVAWPTKALALSGGLPAADEWVTWTGNDDIEAAAGGQVKTGATGIATKTLTVGPLDKGQSAIATACLNGTQQCVTFTAFGARPEFASLQALGGTAQNIASSASPGPISLRVLDMNGNAMAGGIVSLFQALYAWAPPCPPQGRCAQAELLSTTSSTAISGLDGTVTFTPASLPGVATSLVGIATTGNSGTLAIAIEQHP